MVKAKKHTPPHALSQMTAAKTGKTMAMKHGEVDVHKGHMTTSVPGKTGAFKASPNHAGKKGLTQVTAAHHSKRVTKVPRY
jgi:hypothetical protein